MEKAMGYYIEVQGSNFGENFHLIIYGLLLYVDVYVYK
jgi:hypothetical protein